MWALAALLVGVAVVALAPARPAWAGGGRSPCAGRATVRGIDVSKWQGDVDWRAVRAAGVRFAFIRVSDGTTVLDTAFARNWEAARRAGIMRGAYQFFRPEEDPEEQADLLLATMGPLRSGDLPPAIDVEVSGQVEPRELVRRVERWVERVRRATGMRPVVYASAINWAALAGDSRRFRAHALWVAHHDAECPDVPSGWRRWTFHQLSKTSTVRGIAGPVDENRFRGSLHDLRRLTVRSERAAAARWTRWLRRAATDRARRPPVPWTGDAQPVRPASAAER